MKRLVDAATWAMPILIGAFVVVIVIATIAGGGEPDGHLLLPESALGAMLLVAAALDFALLPLYLRHARQNDSLHPARRKRWVFLLRLYGMFSMPVYWVRHVRSAENDGAADLWSSAKQERQTAS
jgi:hypothetical protein